MLRALGGRWGLCLGLWTGASEGMWRRGIRPMMMMFRMIGT